MIYFIRPAECPGPVKIGFTTRPVTERLACLQSCSPVELEVAATCPGDLTMERRFHAAFAKDRAHGEWFRASESLILIIGMVKAREFDFDMLPDPTPRKPLLRPVEPGSLAAVKREARDALERRLILDRAFRRRAEASPWWNRDLDRFIAGRLAQIPINRAWIICQQAEALGG